MHVESIVKELLYQAIMMLASLNNHATLGSAGTS
jgi:hypothetical protein